MAAAKQREGFLTLLKNRNFLFLWLAQIISMTAFYASNYAVLVLIEEVTGSTTLVGLAIISFSLPALIFGAPAGVFVDHMNKRRVLWGSNCLRAIATLAFVVSLFIDRHQLVPVYLLTFLISTIAQFFTPAEGSSIALLVSEEELVPALSLFNITFMLSQAIGYILLAPLMLSLLPTFHIGHIDIRPVNQLYTLVAVLYLICAVLISVIPMSAFTRRAHSGKTGNLSSTSFAGVLSNVWHEMYQGWSFVRSKKPLFLAVVQLSFAGVILLVLGELAVPIVTRLLELPASIIALVFAPAGIGLVLGSVAIPQIARRLGKARTILIGTIALALVTLLLPLTVQLGRHLQPNGWNANPLLLFLMAFYMFIAGVALAFINVPAQTAIQEQSPDWIKGRVLALQLVLYNACSIPILLFIGAIADIFGIGRVLYLLAVGELAFGVWSFYYGRKYGLQSSDREEIDKEKNEEGQRETASRSARSID